MTKSEMSRDERIVLARGRDRLENELGPIRSTSRGNLLGIIPEHRQRAVTLLEIASGLDERRRTLLTKWLGEDTNLRLETALERMEAQHKIEEKLDRVI